MYKKILFTAIMVASVGFSGNAIAQQNPGFSSRAEVLEAVRNELGKDVTSNLDREKLRQLQASPRARALLKRLKKRMDNLSPEQRKQMLKRVKSQSPNINAPQIRLRKKGARRNQTNGPTLRQVPQGR